MAKNGPVMQKASDIIDRCDSYIHHPPSLDEYWYSMGVYDRFYNKENIPTSYPIPYITGWCEEDDELKGAK